MSTAQKEAVMGFTRDRLPVGTHMCLIYDDDDERRKVIGKFLDAGLREHEKVAYFADTMAPAEVGAWLRDLGVEVPEQTNAPAFAITVAEKTYCPGGTFAPEAMLGTLRAYHRTALAEGYPGGFLDDLDLD